MKIYPLFRKFVKKYCKQNIGKSSVAEVAAHLRQHLQFNDSPSFNLMRRGEVDCTGAALIARDILSLKFRSSLFYVIELDSLP